MGKRRSLLPQQMASRPVLAGDSGDEDEGGASARGRRAPVPTATSDRRRRSVLGRNEVVLVPSDSDSDFEGVCPG